MLILGFYRIEDDKVFCLIKGKAVWFGFFLSPGLDGGRILKAQLLSGKRTTALADCKKLCAPAGQSRNLISREPIDRHQMIGLGNQKGRC